MSGPSDAAPLLLARPKRKANSTRNPVENAVTKARCTRSCGFTHLALRPPPYVVIHCLRPACCRPAPLIAEITAFGTDPSAARRR